MAGGPLKVKRGAKVKVHAFRYEAGRNTLEMIGHGSYVILGVVPAEVELSERK